MDYRKSTYYLNGIFIHVPFLFEHRKLHSIIIIGGANERCTACSYNRKNTTFFDEHEVGVWVTLCSLDLLQHKPQYNVNYVYITLHWQNANIFWMVVDTLIYDIYQRTLFYHSISLNSVNQRLAQLNHPDHGTSHGSAIDVTLTWSS